ncbi:MAG: tRNA uridine-5-carboxymethylaminomethyl(34) synthesis enzyme MnmG [Proteobacteria bacterium]|nr:tRNA uridine-5-carboxymethylaminomethyl(34) synthesis enzyme MnmG [Pseudomonadota bacterium]
MSNNIWDVVVVGGGHAGCEAALAAAKMNQKTLMVTMTLDNIAAMSCNPAIGGLAKGHLVKEIDALGGTMGFVADETGIQFRILNRKKGPAVQATRCQSDMVAYKNTMRCLLEQQENLTIRQGEVVSLLWEGDRVKGIRTNLEEEIPSRTVILTTGTFLNGLIHIGHRQFPAGRAWEFPAVSLSQHLKEKGFEIGRLKTGTTPRLDGRTIDFDSLEQQPGDDEAAKFSFWNSQVRLRQVPCYITFTNSKTHDIISENIKKSAMYSGAITGVGARYCPSIEDKINKFPNRDRHQIFLEPTSLQSFEYYPNGISTSLPADIQVQYLQSIKGLETVNVVRPGYAIEYDFVLPTQLKNTLETKDADNLYCAGQINGTSGYEEAAAQGLMAGINAALKNLEKQPLILLRSEAYIGVLLDDLISKGTDEPYRMFTSRAEYRLMLREDNADQRLSRKGYDVGLLSQEKYRTFLSKNEQIQNLQRFVSDTYIFPKPQTNDRLQRNDAQPLPHKVTIRDFLKKPNTSLQLAEQLDDQENVESLHNWDVRVKKHVETEIKYEGYIRRQDIQMQKYLKIESIRIPDRFDYDSVGGLSMEVKQKLKKHRPQTLGQASKISGITPAAITILMVAFQKMHKNRTVNG